MQEFVCVRCKYNMSEDEVMVVCGETVCRDISTCEKLAEPMSPETEKILQKTFELARQSNKRVISIPCLWKKCDACEAEFHTCDCDCHY